MEITVTPLYRCSGGGLSRKISWKILETCNFASTFKQKVKIRTFEFYFQAFEIYSSKMNYQAIYTSDFQVWSQISIISLKTLPLFRWSQYNRTIWWMTNAITRMAISLFILSVFLVFWNSSYKKCSEQKNKLSFVNSE